MFIPKIVEQIKQDGHFHQIGGWLDLVILLIGVSKRSLNSPCNGDVKHVRVIGNQ